VTALTIGYGDVFAITHWGRAISMVAGLCGTALFAILVATVASFSHFAADERRAYEAMCKARLTRMRRQEAARIMLAALRYNAAVRGRARRVAAAGVNADGTLVSVKKQAQSLGRTLICSTNKAVFHKAMRRWRNALQAHRDGSRETSETSLLAREILEVQARLMSLSDVHEERGTATAKTMATLSSAVADLAAYVGAIGVAVGAGPLQVTPALAALRPLAPAALADGSVRSHHLQHPNAMAAARRRSLGTTASSEQLAQDVRRGRPGEAVLPSARGGMPPPSPELRGTAVISVPNPLQKARATEETTLSAAAEDVNVTSSAGGVTASLPKVA
jgi:hypothetical protein